MDKPAPHGHHSPKTRLHNTLLATPSALTQLVNIDGLTPVSGSHVSRWFDAYAIADDQGQLPNSLAAEFITQMCDEALHLDGYDDAF